MYRGVTLYTQLNFRANAKEKIDERERITGTIGPLTGRQALLPAGGNKITRFLQVTRSVIVYVDHAFCHSVYST